jgi:hypothetical protein
MITTEQVEELYDYCTGRGRFLIFASKPSIDSYMDDISKNDQATILDVIGREFLDTPYQNWTDKEYLQMETLIYICANLLDM